MGAHLNDWLTRGEKHVGIRYRFNSRREAKAISSRFWICLLKKRG